MELGRFHLLLGVKYWYGLDLVGKSYEKFVWQSYDMFEAIQEAQTIAEPDKWSNGRSLKLLFNRPPQRLN